MVETPISFPGLFSAKEGAGGENPWELGWSKPITCVKVAEQLSKGNLGKENRSGRSLVSRASAMMIMMMMHIYIYIYIFITYIETFMQ